MKIAIIGAGLSGLVLAHQLKNRADVTLFEKSRSVGGRLATRYADPYQFDHGAQFYLVKTDAFQNFLQPLIEQGIVENWCADFVEITGTKITGNRKWDESPAHYVSAPKMNALGNHLAQGLNIKLQTQVQPIAPIENHWHLTDDKGESLGEFDWVISTAPAEQSAALLPESFAHYERVKNTKMQGCYALMLGYKQPLVLPWQAALVKQADLSWVSVNSSKPKRDIGYSLQALATNNWADEHMEDDVESVQAHMLAELAKVTGVAVDHADHIALHRWRYANVKKQSGEPSLIDPKSQLGACGDWCIQGRVESAFTSAMHLADTIKLSIKATA